MEIEALENVVRIESPGALAFRREFVRPKIPVVITNLYAGQKISQVATQQQAEAQLGGMPVQACRAYFPALVDKLQGRPSGTSATLSLLDLIRSPPEWVCTESPLPPALRELITVPEEGLLRGPADIQLRMFLAREGERTLLHFDSDGRDTLLTQVFGRKRVTIIDVSQTQKVDPLTTQGANVSSRFLASYSPADKRDFLRYTRAWDTILHPGETIYIPMLAWHYIEYVDTSLSFNIRVGRNDFVKYLFDVLDPHVRPFQLCQVQALGRAFSDETAMDAGKTADFERLRALLIAAAAAGIDEARRFRRHLDEIHGRLCPQSFVAPYSPLDLTRSDVDQDITRLRPPAVRPDTGYDTPFALAPQVRFFRPVDAGRPTLLVLQSGRTEAEIALDETNALLPELLQLIAAHQAGISARQLHDRLECDVADVHSTLQVLSERGWLVVLDPEAQLCAG